MICVPITESRATDFLAAIGQAADVAEAVELRLDYLIGDELSRLLSSLPDVLPRLGRTFIFTFRPREQGGQRDLSLEDRRSFWRNLAPEMIAGLSYADFEFDLVESFRDETPPVPWEKIICSEHDFAGTPADLAAIYARLSATPARVVKIATLVERITDCVRLFEIIDRAQAETRPAIVLGMGLAGLPTRVLATSRGALLSFASLARGAESAAGQPTAAEMRDLYRADRLSRASEIYGVIGHPIGHSRSPLIHNLAFRAAGLDAVYLPFEVADLDVFMRTMVHPRTRRLDWRLRGLSVTIPHKLAIRKYLDRIDATAERIGAVNTVVIEGDELVGYNTDAAGAMKPLDELIDVRASRVAVLGAGGAARAVCDGLAERGAKTTIYARTMERARALAAEFRAQAADIDDFSGEADVVINCTPIGMHGHSEGESPVRPESLRGIDLVYDLVYNPEETALLKSAREAGCRTLGGMEMLLAQAAEQYRLWTGQIREYVPAHN
jgi:3-dehydroquinate dehydratase/shikimate dehydrogenase